jgi:hypothetical protein
MQARHTFRLITGFALALAGSACGTADEPYATLKDPPLVQARLHTVTLVSDVAAVAERIRQAGFTPVSLPTNYLQATAVEAAVWGVPEPVAAGAQHFKPVAAGAPDLRLLVMPIAARGRKVDAATDEAFFRNVLGAGVPVWPLPGEPGDTLRVQVWTYLIPNVLEANRRLRDNGIPVIYDPVAITTSYLGDHKMLAIRAPDGTVIQLVETAAQ